MQWQLLIPAFMLGLLSSFHCIGMCGPIALALPMRHLSPAKRLGATLLYNLGRVSTYSLLGLFFGFLGRKIFLHSWQQGFSIAAGVLILGLLLYSLINKKAVHINPFPRFNSYVQQFIGIFLRSQRLFAMFFLGLGNGLLPCGMVYFAITGAIATGSVQGSVLFMGLFGLGTIPVMFALSIFGFIVGLPLRNKIKKITPYVLFIMAILLILRGLNLGIPYISPFLENFSEKTISCN